MDCHTQSPPENRGGQHGPAKGRNVLGLVGLCCTAFCLVGMPLVGLALSGLGLARLGHGWLAWVILGASIAMYGIGLAVSLRHHKRVGPMIVAVVGAGLLVARTAHLLSGWAEWMGMALLIIAWLWDRRLHLEHHSIPDPNAPPGSGGSSFTSGKR